MSVRILQGDCRAMLATLPAESVQCVVTSPPYFGLRDYGVDGQIGLEETPAEYVAQMVDVFREVRRVLRADGVVWLNVGDSFSDKQLLGIPWRLAFALQADGWYLRSEVIWHKPNPMPESVTDRPTKAHEQVFLLTKSARYFYDAGAIAEEAEGPVADPRLASGLGSQHKQAAIKQNQSHTSTLGANAGYATRNARTVWTIATQPFSGSHFATMPPDLAERCVKAGTSERGACPECGAPWERVTGRENQPQAYEARKYDPADKRFQTKRNMGARYQAQLNANPLQTIGWQPTCQCPSHQPIPCTVLDPFGGAGTTGLVADRLGRDAVLIELNPAYAAMARDRIHGDAPLFAEVQA